MSTPGMTGPQAMFFQQYEAVRRDEIAGLLLALFLGSFGIHHFYMRRTGLGILYCCFCWTGIPGIIGVIECFFMPGRVRTYNGIQAEAIAANLGIPVPGWEAATPPMTPMMPAAALTCRRCQTANPAGSRFCSACGNALD